jgi:hypothetical protein
MASYLDKLPQDVTQIGVGAVAGAAAMFIGEKIIADPIRKGVVDWRTKVQDLKAAGKIADADALSKNPPLGAGKISATTAKDLGVLALGILAKAAAPKNTYTEYATDGVIFFAVADLLTRGVGQIAYNAEFGK